MTASLAILYVTFIVGIGVLVAARYSGDLPETRDLGESPLQPDKKNNLAFEEARVEVRYNPDAPLGRHA
jgi:hypothetical protein